MDDILVLILNVKSHINLDICYGERLAGEQTEINKASSSLLSALRTSVKFSSYLPENTLLSIVNFLLVRNARFVRNA